MADVIVTLRHQAAPAPRTGAAGVERELRRVASHDQRKLLSMLRRGRAAGTVRRVRRFWVFNGLEVVATRTVLARLARSPAVASVRPNAQLWLPGHATARAAAATPSDNVAMTGAPQLWQEGVTGSGVVVASIDSGVDGSAPALASGFRGRSHDWFDATGEHPSAPTDTSGHGTWTTGVMVGSGAGGSAPGMAPGARWIAARIFDDRGTSTSARIHAAFEWALDPDGDPSTDDAPQVVNSSWSIAGGGCDLQFEPDLRHLRAAGILPVFASGAGDRDASPANNPSAFAVGAIEPTGAIAGGSGRGPSKCGGAHYPRLVAPGVDIPTSDLFGLGTRQTGTSVAAPHASGALALLLSRFPGISAQRQQAALESSAVDLGPRGPDDVFGAGRLDVAAAARWLASAPDFTLSPARWVSHVVPGATARLAVTVRRVHGFDRTVRLSASSLSPRARPASPVVHGVRGRGTVRLALTTRRSLPPGKYPVTITGRSGATARSVTVALVVDAPAAQRRRSRAGRYVARDEPTLTLR